MPLYPLVKVANLEPQLMAIETRYIILDPAIALGLCFEDRIDATILETVQLLRTNPALVNNHWYMEVAESLLQAERKRRITSLDRRKFLELILALQIEEAPSSSIAIWQQHLEFALENSISVTDAERIALAKEKQGILATNRVEIQKAARKAGVNLVQA